MRTDYFIGSFGEHQIADLGTSVQVVDLFEGLSIPQSYAPISSAAT